MKLIKPALLLLIVASIGCNQKQVEYKNIFDDPLLFSKTVKEFNNVVLHNNFPPMIANRNYTYASIAAYETIVVGDNRFRSLAGQIKHLPALPQHDTTNVNFQLASMLAFCRVGQAVTFSDEIMNEYVNSLERMADSAGMKPEMLSATKKFATHVSDHILKWSKGDNYLQTRSASRYSVQTEDGRWVPTPPMYDMALEPHWKEIRCMVMDSCAQFKPVRPPKYDMQNKNSEFYKAVMEVKNFGDSLTEEQKHIADFWDDNPKRLVVVGHAMMSVKKFSPSGHWMNIVGIGAKHAKADFNTTVQAYAKTSIAIFDAFISCWDEKYRSNYIRPETVINNFAPGWTPHIQTPPFPSYTSGHSTISAAAAEVMTEILGDNLSFTDTSLLEFGINNREIKSFRDAALEASISRVYGGIHYRFDCDNGNTSGRALGEMIVQRLEMKKKNAVIAEKN